MKRCLISFFFLALLVGCRDRDGFDTNYLYLRFRIVDNKMNDVNAAPEDVVVKATDGVVLPVVTNGDYLAFRLVPPQQDYSLSYMNQSTKLSVTYSIYIYNNNRHLYIHEVYSTSHGKCPFESNHPAPVYQIRL